MTQFAFSIVVLLEHAPDVSLRCLTAIAEVSESYEVVLVVEAEDPRYEHLLQALGGDVQIVDRAGASYAEACRRGAQRTQGEVIVWLRDDVEVSAGWQGGLVDAFNDGAAGACPMLVSPRGSVRDAGAILTEDLSAGKLRAQPRGQGLSPDDRRMAEPARLMVPCLAAFALRASALYSVGELDGRLPARWAFTDLACRLAEQGQAIQFVPNVRMRQHEEVNGFAPDPHFAARWMGRARADQLKTQRDAVLPHPKARPIEVVVFDPGEPGALRRCVEGVLTTTDPEVRVSVATNPDGPGATVVETFDSPRVQLIAAKTPMEGVRVAGESEADLLAFVDGHYRPVGSWLDHLVAGTALPDWGGSTSLDDAGGQLDWKNQLPAHDDPRPGAVAEALAATFPGRGFVTDRPGPVMLVPRGVARAPMAAGARWNEALAATLHHIGRRIVVCQSALATRRDGPEPEGMTHLLDADYQPLARSLRGTYRAADPFPHIVIDDFLPAAMAKAVSAAFPEHSALPWRQFDNPRERKKAFSIEMMSMLPPEIQHTLHEMIRHPMVRFLETISGIGDLIVDPDFVGGGMHRIEQGGLLKVHADYNRHPKLRLHRRLNVLVYLNENWEDEYGGHLELWDRPMERCVERVLPIFNRCVIFSTTSHSWHGHPDALTCPPGRARRSLAWYYYTAERPADEVEAEHTTLFRPRPGENIAA